MVAANEWRDYAIDHLADRAVFSVFRRASEMPLFQIVKDPKLARKQGAFASSSPPAAASSSAATNSAACSASSTSKLKLVEANLVILAREFPLRQRIRIGRQALPRHSATAA